MATYSVATCVSKIQAIDTKIKNYGTAKSDLQAVRLNCGNKTESLKIKMKKIGSGTKLGKVEMKNNFEGEMAQTLAKRVADFRDDGNDIVSNGEEIVTKINEQITRIDTESAKLSTERGKWEIELEIASAK